MTVEEVKTLMESSNSSDEWNDNCQKVKTAFGRDYPDFWYEEIIKSGLAQRTMNKWGGFAGITVEYF